MLITIYDRLGNLKTELSPNDSSTQVKEVQGDNVLTLSFTHYDHIELEVDDYVDFEVERFWLTEKYRPKQNSRKEWVYDVKLYGVESMLKRLLVIKSVDGEEDPVFTLTAPPHEHVALIVNCMNNGLGSITDWKVGTVAGTENIVIDYFGKYCDEALKEIAEKVGAEVWVDGETVNICKCEHGEPIPMGYQNGLLSIDPGTADNVKFYTRLFPVGSSRNIDREKYGFTRLQLPDGQKFVEINADKYGCVDHYEQDAFADIYPRRVGTVSEVRSEVKTGEDGNEFTIFYFKDSGLNFDPNDYEIGGLVKRVSFQEGSELAGLGEEDNGTYYFVVNFNSTTWEFEIITIWPYDNDMQLPGNKLIPKIGDKYILWNLSMPEEYYELAEAEFMSAVNKYNADHTLDISVYKASTDHVWVEDNNVVLTIGQRIRLESDEYFPETGYRDSRITKITRKVNLPSSMDIEISDALSRTAMQKMGDNIEGVRSYAESLRESISLPDILRTGDRTRATENNLFSARRTLNEFLSKVKPDKAAELIDFAKGLNVGDFEAGVSGGCFHMDDDGHSYAELDKLYVRIKAFFEELTIIKKGVLAGDQYITPGGGVKCVRVEETDTAYRCYFLSGQDGELTDCAFVAGDQAIARMFNARTGTTNKVSNHSYWRLVTEVVNDAVTDEAGNHYGYIALSKTDCEGGSDDPQAGDEICQFGNRTDTDRQCALLFSTTAADAPCVKLYAGISSYSLEGKSVVSFGRDPQTGKIFFRLGATGATQFLEYNQETGLAVAGKISSQSTVVTPDGMEKTLSDAIDEGKAPNLMSRYSSDATAWHTLYQSGDLWMQTSNDGGQTWGEAVRIQGASYAPNLLKMADVEKKNNNYLIGSYSYDVKPEVGKTYTLTLCYKCAASTSAIAASPYASSVYDPISFTSKTKTVESRTFTLNDHGALPMGMDFYNTPYLGAGTDGQYSEETIVYWAVLQEGNTGKQVQYIPAASEMIGKDGSYPVFNWAKNNSTTTEPTGGWQSTPPTNVQAGEYVWMRTGIVTPPSATPVWSAAVRQTGDTGASGQSVYTLDLSDEMMPMACDSSGNVVGSYKTSQASVFNGGTQVTSDVTYSIAQSTGVSATITPAGLVTPSALTADTATIVVQAVVAGLTLQTTLSLYKVRPGQNGSSFKTLTAPASNASYYPYKTTFTTWNQWAMVESYFQAGNLSDIEAGDTVCVNGIITDKNNTACQFIGTVTRKTTTYVYIAAGAQLIYGQQGQDAVIYSLELSANNISRNALGQLSATSITVQKYKTTGASARVLTTEKSIHYQCIGVDSDWQVPSKLGASTYNIDVPISTALTAIVIELLDGTTVLDRERIPVVTDGTELTTNLVRNSEVNLTTGEYLMRQFDLTEEMIVGQTYTFTIWGTMASGKQYLIFDNKSSVRIAGLSWIANGIYSAVVSIPTTMAETGRNRKKINVYCYPNNGQTSTLDRIKVEKGTNLAPVWTASPKDMDYIKAALQESGSIEGGLVLASLMRLGYTQRNGEYVTMAGMNGIYNGNDKGGGLMLWGGGEMIDPDGTQSGTPATSGIRMDGTAFFCNNVIRLEKNRIMVGDVVQLASDGLTLIDGSNNALRIGDVSVPDLMTAASSSGTLSQSSFSSGTINVYPEGNLYVASNTSINKTALNGNTVLPAGAVVTIGGTISVPQMPGVPLNDFGATVVVEFYLDNTLLQTAHLNLQAGNSVWSTQYNTTLRLPNSGKLYGILRFDYPIPTNSPVIDGSPFAGATFIMNTRSWQYSTSNQNTLGKNGFLAAWGQSLLYCGADGVEMRFNNTRLRLDTNGIRKSTDNGTSWSNL